MRAQARRRLFSSISRVGTTDEPPDVLVATAVRPAAAPHLSHSEATLQVSERVESCRGPQASAQILNVRYCFNQCQGQNGDRHRILT